MSELNDSPATISIDDFVKVDIRAGLIKEASHVEKSKKLLRLQVDFGPVLGIRQVLAGIASTYDPDSLVGQMAAFVTNLAPRPMMGLESNGMILAAASSDKGVEILTLRNDQGIQPGTRVG